MVELRYYVILCKHTNTQKYKMQHNNPQTKMSVSISWEHLKDTIVNCQQCNIERSTTEIKHKNILLSFLLV